MVDDSHLDDSHEIEMSKRTIDDQYFDFWIPLN